MDYTLLGKTGLRVSVLGLGGGGHSRLGQQTGGSVDQAIQLVHEAADLGVNFIDTAEAYGTEPLVGQALSTLDRSKIVLSTKKTIKQDGVLIGADGLVAGIEQSLRNLQTDYVDIYHLHAVQPADYPYVVAELVPTMQKLREQGKIRFLGITEGFAADTGHTMLQQAVHDNIWEVVMVGFNLLNQSARERVLAETQRYGIGTLCMFAVRDALSRPEKLRQTIDELIQNGSIPADAVDADDPLGFLLDVAETIPEAAYRFCRAEPGMDVVLSGTGNIDHLRQNIASILRLALPTEVRQKLIALFAHIDSVSGQ